MKKLEYDVIVSDYDEEWVTAFNNEACALTEMLKSLKPIIDHIGSTSVQGLCAKPIIDILIQVNDVTDIDQYEGQIMSLGYHPMGEYGIQGRRYFWKGRESKHLFHLHCFSTESLQAKNHLLFRDYLRANKEVADQYEVLKKENAKKCRNDIAIYTELKSHFVEQILKKARTSS